MVEKQALQPLAANTSYVDDDYMSASSAQNVTSPSDKPASKDNRALAIIGITIQSMTVTGMTAFYRVIAKEGFHTADFFLIRNIFLLTVGLVWSCIAGVHPIKHFPSEKKWTLFWRMLTGQINFLLLNMAAPLAPVSLIFVCWQTSPFWVSIIAFCALGEPIIPVEMVAIFVCFSAVVIITVQRRQQELLEVSDDIISTDGDSTQHGNTVLGLTFAVIAAFFMGCLAVLTRSLKQVHVSVIIFWYCAGGLILVALFLSIEALATGGTGRLGQYTSRQYLFAFGASFFDSAGLCLLTLAYQSDSSGFVSLFTYMNIVWAYLCDVTIFDESLNTIELCAAILILLVAIGIAYYKLRKQRQDKQNSVSEPVLTKEAQEQPLLN